MNALACDQVAVSDEMEELVKARVAPSTVKMYERAVQQLETWLDGRSLSDNLLASYITALYQEGKSPATISKVVAAVKWTVNHHRTEARNFIFEITERTLAGIRRKGRDRGRGQVDAMTWPDVERVCIRAQSEGTVTGWRDSALIRLMSDCLLRIGEVVAVNVEDIGGGLTIHSSKTDPGTSSTPGVTLYIGPPTREVISRYCETGGIADGALFRRIRRGHHISDSRLTVDGVRKIIKRRAREAGLQGNISGHSLRVGSAVSLAQAGASVVNMQVAGRWKSPQMPAHYARAELAEQGAIARFKYGRDGGG